MVVQEYLALIRRFPVVSLEEMTGGSPFIVIAPHPDDETLGTGGLIAQACEAGQDPYVVILTDGSGSHPHSKQFPRDALVALREREVETAMSILGLNRARVEHFGLVDTQVPSSGSGFESAVDRIEALVRQIGAKALFVTWGYDPHCDHQAAAAIAEAASARIPGLALWAYPIWGWHLDPATPIGPAAPRGARLDVSARLPVKKAAIAAHASQLTSLVNDDPDGFRFSDTTIAPFVGDFEHFVSVRP